jgi:hypothetical protein
MMQLICNGVRLEIYEDAGIQFTHQNPLFAFDDLKCERTTQFKLPSTPTNDRVFGLARVPAYKGDGMRRRFAAELQLGVVVKNGFLYVTSYDGKDYDAVFVTGELIGLQAVKNAGKLPEIVRDYVRVYVNQETTAAKNNFDYDLEQIKYRQAQDKPCAPSVSVAFLVNRICTDFGLQVTLPQGVERLAIVPPYARTLQDTQVAFTNTGHNVLPILDDEPTDYSNELTAGLSLLEQADRIFYTYVKEGGSSGIVQQTWEYLTQCLIAQQNLSLSFPNDFPADLFLIKVTDPGLDGMQGVEFLGDYSFSKYESGDESVDTTTGECVTTDTGVVITGDPLRGRTVDVQNGDVLLFVTPLDYVNGRATSNPQWVKNGWAFHQRDWSASIKAAGAEDEAQVGETIRLRDNVPDIDFSDLLKTIAAVTGTVLNFTNGRITFEDLDTSAYPVLDKIKIIERKDVERRFGDYAQRNIVQYTQDDITPQIYIFREEYTIDNDNLEREKELFVLPFSPASEIYESGQIRAYIDNSVTNSKEFALLSLTGRGGDDYLHRVPLSKCAGVQALCDVSTQFKVSVRMTAYEHEQITEKTLLLIDGTRYVWTERSWQSDVGQFTLARV